MTPYNFEENQLRIEEDKKRKIRQAYIAQQDKTKWSSVLDKRFNQMGDALSSLDPRLWTLFQTKAAPPPAVMPTASPGALAINNPVEQIDFQNRAALRARNFHPDYINNVLTNPVFATTKKRMIEQGVISDVPTNVSAATPYQPPLVQTLNPDVQNVFANLGVGQKRIPNLEKVAKEAAPAATGKMDYLSLLKILGMVNSPQATSNVNKGITPGVTPGVAGSRIQEEDLYARYRR